MIDKLLLFWKFLCIKEKKYCLRSLQVVLSGDPTNHSRALIFLIWASLSNIHEPKHMARPQTQAQRFPGPTQHFSLLSNLSTNLEWQLLISWIVVILAKFWGLFSLGSTIWPSLEMILIDLRRFWQKTFSWC